jgi:predicted site-specific integrase-resolvase
MTTAMTNRRGISALAAFTKLECRYVKLLKFVALGKIRVIAEPGTSMKFHPEDVEALAAELSASNAEQPA